MDIDSLDFAQAWREFDMLLESVAEPVIAGYNPWLKLERKLRSAIHVSEGRIPLGRSAMVTIPQSEEIWKSIPGYEGRYEASSEGRLRTVKGKRLGLRASYPLTVTVNAKTGYHFANVTSDGKMRHKGVHQLVAAAFIGPCPDGMEVNHIDLDKSNNQPGNLEYVTHARNLELARQAKSWAKHGADTYNSKLTDDDVRAIRHDPRSQRTIAVDYHVSQVTIQGIKARRTWNHVE